MADTNNPMEGAGGTRSLAARWVITGELVLNTAAHFGGEPEAVTDMPILRDRISGRPLLPGVSIAGALRGYLSDVLNNYGSDEDAAIKTLFGTPRSIEGDQSPLIVYDSLGTIPQDRCVENRDGVAIDAARGTAEDHKKFDLQVVPAGTVFPVRFDLLVSCKDDETELRTLLIAALEGLKAHEISLGARRSRGLGEICARRWHARRYDLQSSKGWRQWALSDYEPNPKGYNSIRLVVGCAEPKINDVLDDKRVRMTIDTKLFIKHGILVRAYPQEPDAPDSVHLHSGSHPIISGSSMAGALRHQAKKIIRHILGNHVRADARIDGLFGPRLQGRFADSFDPKSSRLRISENIIDGNHIPVRETRIKIDRFTQGVFDGTPFEEQPEHGGVFGLRLEIRKPQPGDLGLLFLLLKDLLDEQIPIGGTSSIGRGVVGGDTATVTFQNCDGIPDQTVQLDLHNAKPEVIRMADKEIDILRGLSTHG